MTLDELIVNLIKKQSIASQEELSSLLTARGHQVTQSTLSRHLKNIGAEKRNGRYVVAKATGISAQSARCVLSPPNLIFLRTSPGLAHALGYQLDQSNLKHIAGTIAGDDTLLIAVTDPKLLVECRDKIIQVLNLEP